MTPLPRFRYHPDPLATGCVRAADTVCECCGQARGFIYTGPVYSEDEYQDCFCPWCIADGSAHARLDVSFTDCAGIGGYGGWDAVEDAVIDEVSCRTPGFNGWQQEQWWTHCGDAAQFMGRAGQAELLQAGAQAMGAIQANTGLQGEPWERFFGALDKDGSPTAYLFRCRHCGQWGGYQDCD